MLELSLLGGIVGLLSGFFGIGGGTVLVPLLLLLGYDTKVAIGISVIQMVFSSVYGSYLNNKKGTLDFKMIFIIGVGGFLGALLSGFVTASLNNQTLEMIFLSFALFALIRLFIKTKEHTEQKKVGPIVLFSIGLPLGAISMSIGVGGSILLVPILVGFLHVPMRNAISAGLFFVVFSSIAGFYSHANAEHLDYERGVIIGVSSLLGVYAGIMLKDSVSAKLQRRLIVGFYLLIVLYLTKRVFF